MIAEFSVKGWWRENEASGAASAILSRHAAGDEMFNGPWHIRVEAETTDGSVKIISDDDLTVEQITRLRDYFEKHPEQDMPDWERAEKVRRQDTMLRVKKLTTSTGLLQAGDVRDAVRALAELIGEKLE